MTKEEAEKKVLALCSAKWVEGSNDSDESKETAKMKQEIIDALCADHSGDSSKMMSLEKFMVQVARVLSGKAPAKELETIYNRMHGSCSTKPTVSPFSEIQGKWPGKETTEQLLDALKDQPVVQDAVKGGARFEFYAPIVESVDGSIIPAIDKASGDYDAACQSVANLLGDGFAIKRMCPSRFRAYEIKEKQ